VSGDNGCSQVLDFVEVAKINTDGSLGTFSHTTPLPAPRWHHTAAFDAVHGDLYVLGGKSGASYGDPEITDVVAAHLYPDGAAGPWRTMQALPTGHNRGTAAVIGKFLVMVQVDTQVAPLQ
jgi:hypothetical protein